MPERTRAGGGGGGTGRRTEGPQERWPRVQAKGRGEGAPAAVGEGPGGGGGERSPNPQALPRAAGVQHRYMGGGGTARDVLEGGGGEGVCGWDPPSSQRPPMAPAEGGAEHFEAEILLAPKAPKENCGCQPQTSEGEGGYPHSSCGVRPF